MRIDIDSLSGSSGAFSHTYHTGELEFSDERVRLLDPPEISGQIVRKGSEIALNGRLATRAEVDCDRCLKSIEMPVRAEFSLRYVTPDGYESTQAAKLEDTDLGLSIFDGQTIDLDEIVREQVLLSVPTRSLCGEDCKGFCPVCGGDRNLKECGCHAQETDPRWAGLKEIGDRK